MSTTATHTFPKQSSPFTAAAAVMPLVWLVIYAFTLGLVTLLFGGVLPWTQSVLPLFCAVLLAVTPGLGRTSPVGMALGVALPVVLVLGWAGLQLTPVFGANSYWRLVEGGAETLSISPFATFNHIVYVLGYLAFAVAVYQAGRLMPGKILATTCAVILAACVYGLFLTASGTEKVLWLPKQAYTGFLTATFVNKNSFATLAAMGVLGSMAMALQRVGEISSRLTLRQRVKAFWLLVMVPGWPWFTAAALCFMALVLTGSRAGIAAGICGLLVLPLAVASARRAVRLPLAFMLTCFAVFSLVVLGAVGQMLGRRLVNAASDSSLRDAIYTLVHQAIGLNPLSGYGFGTFEAAFSTLRDAKLLNILPFTVEHAHNTYLELALELGLPATALLALACAALLVVLITGVRTRRRAVIWPALGLATVVLVGGHALADFSLSVPAVTLVAISFVMLGAAQTYPEKEEALPTPRLAWGFRLAMVPLACVSGWMTLAEYHAYQARPVVQQMVDGERLSRSEVLHAQRELQACLRVRPGHVICRENLAQSYLTLATSYGLRGPMRDVATVYLNLAAIGYGKVLQQTPANPWAWYRLSRINAFLGNSPLAIHQLANSLMTGPYEPSLAVLRVPYMLSLLPQSTPEDAALFGLNATGVWQARKWPTERVVKANPAVWPTFAAMLQAQQAPLPRWLTKKTTPPVR